MKPTHKWIQTKHTDGSYIDSSRKGGTGGVFRDSNGDWVLGYLGNTLKTNNIKTELIALVQEPHIAKEDSLLPLEISVDCKDIVSLINNNIDSKHLNIVTDCRDLLHQLENPSIKQSGEEQYGRCASQGGSKYVYTKIHK